MDVIENISTFLLKDDESNLLVGTTTHTDYELGIAHNTAVVNKINVMEISLPSSPEGGDFDKNTFDGFDFDNLEKENSHEKENLEKLFSSTLAENENLQHNSFGRPSPLSSAPTPNKRAKLSHIGNQWLN